MPATPVAPTTSVSGSNVIVTWTAPYNNGSPLTAYNIYLRMSNLVYAMQTTHCDGTTSAIIAATSCTIPFSALTSSPFSLVLNNPVFAEVVAVNIYGNSVTSPSGSGAVILYVPDAPLSVANNPSVTSATRIGLTWTEGFSTGGTPVLDYTINYSTTASNFVLLASGLTTLSYTTTAALVKGTTYYFQILARNSVGFSLPSTTLSVLAAQVPNLPTNFVTTAVETNI